jgi:hypothetical protein
MIDFATPAPGFLIKNFRNDTLPLSFPQSFERESTFSFTNTLSFDIFLDYAQRINNILLGYFF